jgi:pimeloyl-ACP methyl ester carboxylesterase
MENIMSFGAGASPAGVKLDPAEQHLRIPGLQQGSSLFLRRLSLPHARGRDVLYVHGATFPSALSVAHRCAGHAWRDALCDAGFDVWALDFHGFGGSDPYPEMARAAAESLPLGRAADADAWAGQLAYDPARLRAPVAIIRGEWDNYCIDADAHWLFQALTASPIRRDIKINRGTHLMHLEAMRKALYRESIAFLCAGDEPLCD